MAATRSPGPSDWLLSPLFQSCCHDLRSRLAACVQVIVIEANTVPGMTPSTVLFHQGLKESPPLSPTDLLAEFVELAKESSAASLSSSPATESQSSSEEERVEIP